MLDHLRVLRVTAIAAFSEYTVIYTWRSWIFAWLSRLLVQVAFFGLIGRLLGSQERTDYLVLGNAVAIVAIEAVAVILVLSGERRSGTLPLMTAAPAGHLTVYLGRGVHFVASGVVSSCVAVFMLAALFDVTLPWPRAALIPLIILVIGVSAYGFGVLLGAAVLRFPAMQWAATNVSFAVIVAFAGVNVPVDFWPPVVAAAAMVLPVTHGLLAIRTLIAEGDAAAVLAEVMLEVVVAAGWFLLAGVLFHRMVRRGRSDGSLDFGE
jgi:ABC-2 type transport system permease protein